MLSVLLIRGDGVRELERAPAGDASARGEHRSRAGRDVRGQEVGELEPRPEPRREAARVPRGGDERLVVEAQEGRRGGVVQTKQVSSALPDCHCPFETAGDEGEHEKHTL